MLGETLKKLRRERGLTLEEVALAVGTSKQTVSRYEKGVISNIPHEKVEALARALSVSPSALMGWEEGEGFPAPKVTLDSSVTDFYDFTKDSFKVEDYQFHPFDFEIPMAI